MSGSFYFPGLSFNGGILSVRLEKKGIPWALVEFEAPRAFRFFNESDKFSYIETYDGPNLLNPGQGCSINESTTSGYLDDYYKYLIEARLEDGIRSIIIISPQECVEVISFESPSITML